MEPQNNPQVNPSINQAPNIPQQQPPRKKYDSVGLGIFVGIVQIVFTVLITSSGFLNSSFFGYTSPLLYLIIIFLPLILELIFLRKSHPYFLRGAALGTLLIPLIGIGLCFGMIFLAGGLGGF